MGYFRRRPKLLSRRISLPDSYTRVRAYVQENPDLIPDLPGHVAEVCVARVHWNFYAELSNVSENWAAYLESSTIVTVRLQNGLSDRLFLLLCEPLGGVVPPRFAIFGSQAVSKLQFHNPLAIIELPWRLNKIVIGFSCAIVGHNIFIIGGELCGKKRARLRDVWQLNILSKKWNKTTPMYDARHNFICEVLNGKIFVAGGTDHPPPNPTLQSAEVFYCEHDVWIKVGHLDGLRTCYLTWTAFALDHYNDMEMRWYNWISKEWCHVILKNSDSSANLPGRTRSEAMWQRSEGNLPPDGPPDHWACAHIRDRSNSRYVKAACRRTLAYRDRPNLANNCLLDFPSEGCFRMGTLSLRCLRWMYPEGGGTKNGSGAVSEHELTTVESFSRNGDFGEYSELIIGSGVMEI